MYLPILAITVYFIAIGLVVGTRGNFPLNDDWMYASEVRNLLTSGHLQILGGGPACAFHIVFGAFVCKLFGFSFETLRILSLAFGWLTCTLLYQILRELACDRKTALLGAAVLAGNPLFINLIFCYMTDVPALAYMLAFLLFLLRAVRQPSTLNLVAASTALIIAIQVRQNTALIIAVNGLFLLLRRLDKLTFTKAFLFLLILPCGSALLADMVMKLVNSFPGAYDWYKAEIARLLNPLNFGQTFLLECKCIAQACAYIGLFCAPLLIGFVLQFLIDRNGAKPGDAAAATDASEVVPQPTAQSIAAQPTAQFAATYASPQMAKKISRSCAVLAISFCGVEFASLVLMQNKLMPFSKNLWLFPTLGPYTLLGSRFEASTNAQAILTIVCVPLAMLMLHLVLLVTVWIIRIILLAIRNFKRTSEFETEVISTQKMLMFSSFLIAFALGVFHTSIANLDRYFLMAFALSIPAVLLVIPQLRSRLPVIVAYLFAAAFCIYSVCAEHDYLAWNRARWQALSALALKNIPVNKIDGGEEFNYINDPALSSQLMLGPNTFKSTHKGTSTLATERSWSANEEDFVISLTPIHGYNVEAMYPYSTFLKSSRERVFVLAPIVRN